MSFSGSFHLVKKLSEDEDQMRSRLALAPSSV